MTYISRADIQAVVTLLRLRFGTGAPFTFAEAGTWYAVVVPVTAGGAGAHILWDSAFCPAHSRDGSWLSFEADWYALSLDHLAERLIRLERDAAWRVCFECGARCSR